ncbi:hypothetical protein Cph01nite_22050 [Cellulomonas phragmiteti]|uniref:Peptidoglycan binding-like domain-containing protein n=2 Tax=Cellulomonas phragmiteti TaxID=478780 RepID=A0ABQ4DM60_9CELL|nr:hypothetical protein Cph01nite_22050 [Cellulomonas phragmiteti]
MEKQMKKNIAAAALAVVMAGGIVVGMATTSTATANRPCTAATSFGSGQFKRVVPTANGSTDCYLVNGNSGNGVRALQRALVYCEGYSVGSSGIDGSFGNATKSAVLAFQRSFGLTPDGQYGNQTRNWLKFLDRASNPTGYFYCNRV